jgi:hypothetical protein
MMAGATIALPCLHLAVCTDHGGYAVIITPDSGPLDLATLHPDLVKERAAARDPVMPPVMARGGDWAFGCQLVDEAFATSMPWPGWRYR